MDAEGRVTRNMSVCNDFFFFFKLISTLRSEAVFSWTFRERCYLFGWNSVSSLCTRMFLMAVLQANRAVQQFVNSD